MQTINKSEYGGKIYANFGVDISSNTALTMELEPESGATITVTPTLGASDQWVGDSKFEANNYVYYTTTDGMFDNYIGRYRIKATAKVGSTMYATEPKLLQVTS